MSEEYGYLGRVLLMVVSCGNIAIVKQVELEFLERLEDKFVDVPEAAFPEDPERQQELHAELRRMFNDLRAMIEE